MEILVDTNVLLDFVQERAEADTVAEIITICAKDDNITGYISAHSLMDMCYILRKIFSADERLDIHCHSTAAICIHLMNDNIFVII